MLQSVWASLFLLLLVQNLLVFTFILAPSVYQQSLHLVICWPISVGGVFVLWLYTARSDPGWSCQRSLPDQATRVSEQEPEIESFRALLKLPLWKQADGLAKSLGGLQEDIPEYSAPVSSEDREASSSTNGDHSASIRGVRRLSNPEGLMEGVLPRSQ